jgi:pyrroloquinoline quinone biosynthesis protein B
MRVKILGSAAGGGFPQWNCACPNCRAMRAGRFRGKPRTQTQVAVSEDFRSWFLLGASPDLRAQIEATPELHPREQSPEKPQRHSPIAGAVLLNADIDHVLGLLLLRELQPLRVHATKSVRRILTKDNSMFAMLQRTPEQLRWTDVAFGNLFALQSPSGEDSDMRGEVFSLSTHYPAYVSASRQSELVPGEASVGLILQSLSGKRLAFLPAVPQIDDILLAKLISVDVLLFDGTFWRDDELIHMGAGGNTARQMGHVPISSDYGSLIKLAQLRHPRKIYIHINNTNPMLNEATGEYHEVTEAGCEIAEDGWQFDL